MIKTLAPLLLCLVSGASSLSEGQGPSAARKVPATKTPNFQDILSKDAALSQSIGFTKLNADEKTALVRLLTSTYESGVVVGQSQTAAVELPDKKAAVATAIMSRVDDVADDILTLRNGSIVEITAGFAGFVGAGRECVLFKSGSSWRIWIARKRTYRCNVLKEGDGQFSRKVAVREETLSDVKGSGSLLRMLDGSLYEVGSIDTVSTGLWLPMSSVLILDDTEVINLDDGDEKVSVTRLR